MERKVNPANTKSDGRIFLMLSPLFPNNNNDLTNLQLLIYSVFSFILEIKKRAEKLCSLDIF
jgi:hypothetical protein